MVKFSPAITIMFCFSTFISSTCFSVKLNTSVSKTSLPVPSEGLTVSVANKTCHTSVYESDSACGVPSPHGCCSPALAELWCRSSSRAALPPPMMETDVQNHVMAKNGLALTQVTASPSAGWKAVQGKRLAPPAPRTEQAEGQPLARLLWSWVRILHAGCPDL